MKRARSLIVSAISAMAVLLLPLGALAATKPAKVAPYHMSRLFYYTEGDLSRKSFFAHGAQVDIFAPQTYTINADGTMSGTLKPDLVAYAKKHKIKIMPLVTNAGFSATQYKNLLADESLQNTTLTALIAEAKDKGYWGWQFDFEQMDETDRDLFSAFIQKMADGLHKAGYKVSVAVISKVSDNRADYKEGLWHKLIGVYDYDALGKSADFVSIMSYDDPESTGAVTEFPWLMRVLAYTLDHIPPQKVSLGVGLYYWARDDATGKLRGIGGNQYMDEIIKKRPVWYTFDEVNRVPVMHYLANDTSYSLYYENSRSMQEKIRVIKNAKLYGLSAWAIGLEVPSVWKTFY